MGGLLLNGLRFAGNAAGLASVGSILGGLGLGAYDVYNQFTDKDRLIADLANIEEDADGIRKLNPYQQLKRTAIDALNRDVSINDAYIQDKTDTLAEKRRRNEQERANAAYRGTQQYIDQKAEKDRQIRLENDRIAREIESNKRLQLLKETELLNAYNQRLYAMETDRRSIEGQLANQKALMAQAQQNQQNELEKFYYLQDQKALDAREKRRDAIVQALLTLGQGVQFF